MKKPRKMNIMYWKAEYTMKETCLKASMCWANKVTIL